MTAAFPLIEISGSPVERGRQHGAGAADRIRAGIAHYAAQLDRYGIDRSGLRDLVQDFLPAMEAFEPDYVAEMRGIAEGADLPFEEIVFLNARTEILKLASEPDLRAQIAAATDGCTAVAVMPAAAAEGHLIHAQNWDWKADCAETSVVLRLRRDDGPDVLTFTEAGGLGRSGMNAAGVSITANFLQSDRDFSRIGVPLVFIRRKALEQGWYAHALKTVYATPKTASNNVMVCHVEGVCINFECAPDESFRLHPEGGLLTHANHFNSPIALVKLRDTSLGGFGDSMYRDLRLRDLLEPHLGGITVEHVKTALDDRFGSPFSVCRPVRPNSENNLSATVASVVMQPHAGIMEIAPLPAHGGAYTTYSLPMDTAAEQAG